MFQIQPRRLSNYLLSLSLLSLICIFGCGEPVPTGVSHSEFRALKTRKSYEVMSFSDLQWDWTTQRPSTEDPTISFCVPALSPVQFDEFGCWYEADENIAAGCKSIAGDYVLLITSQGELKPVQFNVSVSNNLISELQSQHSDIVPLECVVYDSQAQTSGNPKIEHLRALAQNKEGSWVMVTSRETISRRELAHDLVEKEFRQAFVLETGTRDAGWYRYADAVFKIGRHPKSLPFQNNWLVLRSAR